VTKRRVFVTTEVEPTMCSRVITLHSAAAVSHPNLYAFLGHPQNTTVDNMCDMARIRNDLKIRRPRLKANLLNELRINTCLSRFDNDVVWRSGSVVSLDQRS